MVIDTPGVFDTLLPVEELRTEVEKCIRLSVPGPHVFLLVLRLDARFTAEEKNAIEWIRENFGEKASEYTLVLFTRGEVLKEKPIEKCINQSPELKKFIQDHTAGYVVFDNTCILNRTQVADLIEKVDEIVKSNGTYYTSSLYKEAQEKMESDEKWSKNADHMNNLGNQLFLGGLATVLSSNPAASIGGLAIFAGAGISKVASWWMKPAKKDT